MATKKIRKHRKDSSGNLNVIHYETSADIVLMPDGTSVSDKIGGLQPKITVDSAPKSGSTNPVSSGGVYESVEGVKSSMNSHASRHKSGGADPIQPSDIGAVPTTRTVNGKSLESNIELNSDDVGAVPSERTVNGKPLSDDVTLSAGDVGAVPNTGGTVTGDLTIRTSTPLLRLAPTADGPNAIAMYINDAVQLLVRNAASDQNRRGITIRDSARATDVKDALVFMDVVDGSYKYYNIIHAGNMDLISCDAVGAITFAQRAAISDSADLNNYTTVGCYACGTVANAKKLANSPTQNAFIMDVVNLTGSAAKTLDVNSYHYFSQRIYDLGGKYWERKLSTNTKGSVIYGEWVRRYDGTNITYGTAALTAGTSSLATGDIYLQYE